MPPPFVDPSSPGVMSPGRRAPYRVADFALQRGELQTRALLLDTTSDIISGDGTINLPELRRKAEAR
jgi:hypothetical protein